LYNHSNTPNTLWQARVDNDRIYQWVAMRDIYTDEELFTYYGDNSYFESLNYEPK
jgi:SET domain-containing protein